MDEHRNKNKKGEKVTKDHNVKDILLKHNWAGLVLRWRTS